MRSATSPLLLALIGLGALGGCGDPPSVVDAGADRAEAATTEVGADGAPMDAPDVLPDLPGGDTAFVDEPAGLDGAGLDGAGLDGAGLDGAAPDGTAPDGTAADVGGDAPDGAAPACRVDSDCPSGLVCERDPGRCVACATSLHCAAGQACSANRCVAGTPCTNARMCPDQVCDAARGVCADCVSDVDCPSGRVCRAGNCLGAPPACRSTRECSGRAQVCDPARSVCVDCSADGDCAAGQYCHADTTCRPRACVPGAATCVDASRLRVCDARGTGATETPCAAGEVCAAGRCQPRVCTPGEATCTSTRERRACNADGTALVTTACADAEVCAGGACVPCPDADGDGVSDSIEGAPSVDTDRDGTPDFRDLDSDGDGFSDAVEAGRRYPGFEGAGRVLTCGAAPDDCDAAGDAANLRDLDSDDDGLADAAERTARTNPCAADTDGDGLSDLVEDRAGSDPTSEASRLPANADVVVLPYRAATHQHRELSATARVRAADVFFLIDNSASMDPIIASLNSDLSSVIVPGLQRQIADVRMGVGSFDSMPVPPQGYAGSPGDYTLWVRQALSADASASQRALSSMRTIAHDTGSAFYGGDEPECQTEAAFQTLEGLGSRGHEADPAALISVRNAIDPRGNGWVPAVVPSRDCGDAARFGWGCFDPGRVPILVLVSDANWYDGCVAGSPTTPGGVGRTCADLSAALVRRGAWFVGVDVGVGVNGRTYNNALPLARATGSVDAADAPVVVGVGSGGLATMSARIVAAVTTLAGQSRSDVTARVTADPAETRLPAGRSTADFVRAVTPTRATPEAPDGYTRRDTTTFQGAAPTASLVFDVDLFNDFVPGADAARVFVATVQAIGRASAPLESRTLYLLVPRGSP